MKIEVEEVAVMAQDYSATINVADYPAETLAYWFTYGVRRAYQDGINASAKKLRDAGAEVIGTDLFADRDKLFREAAMGMRSGDGDDPITKEAKSLLRVVVKQGDAAKYKNTSPEDRSEMVDKAWDSLSDVQRESYMKGAKASMERKAADKAARAAEAAELAKLGIGVKL